MPDAKPTQTTSTSSDGGPPIGSLSSAPAFAMGALYQSFAQSTGALYQNAVQAQQQLAILAQAVTALGVASLQAVTPGAKPPAGGGSPAGPAPSGD